ncbi:MAG: CBS and ACT domain-containing protein [Caldibacillus thermoamylovorans]
MLVEEVMKTNVFTLKENDSIQSAIYLIENNQIRHIPIVDEQNRCIGIVSDRDIRSAVPSIFSKGNDSGNFDKPIHLIMTKDVITVHPLDFLEEVAAYFYKYQIGCLPVVQNGKLIGIITETDVLFTFVKLTGADQPGSFVEIRLSNKPGNLSKVLEIFNSFRVNIESVHLYPDKKEQDKKIIVFRLNTINPLPIIEKLKAEKYAVLWPNFPGMTYEK